ncbi:MAG: CBS domain-containing protein [Deltaproteobacteria bacterium]|jgi:CBS domain-containing protein|nr:CBS domain-containing protein [Deltaproteobacteria bacterium]
MSFGLLENNFLFKSIGFVQPPSPITVNESTSIKDAVFLMKKHNIGCCLVVKPDGKLCGIVSERDIVQKVVLNDVDLQERVSTIMIKDPQTTKITATVAHVLNLMSEGNYRHIPLVDKEDIPVGIVSVKSIIIFISKQLAKGLGLGITKK